MLDQQALARLTSAGERLANWSDGAGLYACRECGDKGRTIFTAGSTSDSMVGRSNEVWGGTSAVEREGHVKVHCVVCKADWQE